MPAVNASSYDLYIWPADQPKPSDPFASNINAIRFNLSSSIKYYGITYKWQVMAKYYGCESTPGPVQTFMIRNLPDLIVNHIQIPSSAFTGQNIEITWDVKNQGLGSTLYQRWFDDLYLIDTISERFSSLGRVPNMTYLEPGQSYSKKASFTVPKYNDGLFNVFARADYDLYLIETKKDNNKCSSTNPLWVKIPPLPDLYVSSVSAPSDIFSEDTVQVSWSVINKGQWPTETDVWTDRIYISQDYSKAKRYVIGDFKHTGDTLKQGQSYSNTQAVIIPEAIFGKYYIYVETDINNNVYEHAYDGNNVTQSDSINVILRPPADLMVDNIIIPKVATNIESAYIQWRVTNNGNSSPSDKTWKDAVYLSKSPNYDLSSAYSFKFSRSKSAGIPAGLTYNNGEYIKIPDNIVPGDYYVYVKTDADEEVFEYLFEENNILRSDTTIKISIAPCPDLIVTKFTHPDSAGSGERISMSYTVTNKGAASAKGGWVDKVFINNGNTYSLLQEIKKNGPLPQDSSYTITSNVVLPNGFAYGSNDYGLMVQTDYDNKVYEYNKENNNKNFDSIFIKPSDLSIITASVPGQAYSASDIEIEWVVKNQGDASPPAEIWCDKIDILDSLLMPVTFPGENMYGKSGPVLPGTSYTQKHEVLIPDGIFGNCYIQK